MAISNEKKYWTVGYSKTWERWQIRERDLTDPDSYVLKEDLGPELKDAALEFDGDFQLINEATNIVELTDSVPWMAVVTTSGKLYVKLALADISTANLLDTSVKKVSLCRGFKSNQYGVDLGLVVAYLKTDGSAWYRSYEPVDNVKLWTEPVQILDAGTGNTNIQIFRLLDYRTGIYVQGINKLYISERQYIGNTIKSESIESDATNFLTIFPTQESPDPPSLQIVAVNDYTDSILEVVGNYPLFDYDSTWNDITMTAGPPSQGIDHLIWDDGKLYIHLKEPLSGLTRLVFKCRAGNRKGYKVTDQCKPVWPELTFERASPPVYVEEIIDTVTALNTVLNMQERQVYNTTVEEIVDTDVSLTTVYTTQEVTTTDIVTEDNYIYAMTTATTTLNLTQTGDVPV